MMDARPQHQAHVNALRSWLTRAMGTWPAAAEDLLQDHAQWLTTALMHPDQPWLPWWPQGVETSARWLPQGVERVRFIVGTTLTELREPVDLGVARLVLPQAVRADVDALVAAGQRPTRIQWGMGHGPAGLGERLYLEEGTLQGATMWAWEWGATPTTRRAYRPHDPRDLAPLGMRDNVLSTAWAALQAQHGTGAGLKRVDEPGDAVAIHAALRRVPVLACLEAVQSVGLAIGADVAAGTAWLQDLPEDAAVNGVALGRDRLGRLHMSVYVVPDETRLPQPGPPPGDLRRLPGGVLVPVAHVGALRPHAWVLMLPIDVPAPHRPVAKNPHVQVFLASAIADPIPLAKALVSLGACPPLPWPVDHPWRQTLQVGLDARGLVPVWSLACATFG